MSEKKYWKFKLENVSISNTSSSVLARVCENECEAILDTGTTLIWGPTYMVHFLNEALNAKYDVDGEVYVFDCNKTSVLPNINFAIGNRVFSLTYEDYVFKYKDGCYSVLVGGSNDFWIIGHVFIVKFYSIFDSTNNRIGLADAK